MYNDIFMI